jgi:pyrroloquinoline quinone biosynthesis protein B
VAVRVRILGAAAGGGFPQWNCGCPPCQAARQRRPGAEPRTQSSIAVRGATGPWFLVNASPDLRQQLPGLDSDRSNGVRSAPFGAVLLTDAEIDHTAGLLLLRESSEPIRVYSPRSVRTALTADYPLLRMLESYCGVRWSPLEPGEAVLLPDSSLEVEAFETGGDAPRYARGRALAPASVGLAFRDREGGVLIYAPGLAELDERLVELLDQADCVLVDGTFWRDDELVALGAGNRTARDMGHVPLAEPGGSLATLARLRPRTVLVHVNNTNPVLLDDSPERALLAQRGVEVAHDGMEIELP